eukprot:CAMPEP_0178681516 /NCGR_PEP_ID=MMETSP0699-20121125/1277_1 /TAXON_ID=265572 /ORGANISM="Extubocellulus spinifer, Strain CCMP396" /LENGTH=307 /DNA_ID=CAMNT_0020325979 /DNA_START=70 /DNA_END=993 /DNA_ORIENTATION=-
MILSLSLFALLLVNGTGFQHTVDRRKSFSHPTTPTTPLNVIVGDEEHILDKTQRILQDAPAFDERFDSIVRSVFPSSITNSDLEYRVVSALAERGFTTSNTLLCSSLCSDELATRLADDFAKIYGRNFNLGGLAGFPFAGNIGFQTMSGHIPDSGFCLLIYGPHVGLTRDGVVGKVEREGVSLDDICCRSAIEASNFVMGASTGVAANAFTDLQQGAVQNLVAPLVDRLKESEHPMLELPYGIYDIQKELVEGIVNQGIGDVKGGIALLGGVQINTGPDTLDYFHPLRFDLINNRGELVENMLPTLP